MRLYYEATLQRDREHEYLREFETEFENILGCESGVYLGSIHEKNQ